MADNDENDIEADIDDETGEVRVRPAPPAPAPPPPPARVRSNGNGAATRRERTGVGATATQQQTPSTQAAPPAEPPTSKDAPWSSNQADLVWDEMNGGEHPRSLAKLGKTAYDVKIVVTRTVAGARYPVDTMQGSEVLGADSVSPGDALRQRVENQHMAITDAPCTYDVGVNWKPGGTFYGRGLVLSFPSRGEIVATRGVSRSAQGGGAPPTGYGQPYQAPYPPQVPPYGAPQPPQAQQPPAGYGAAPAQPQYAPNPAYPQPPAHDPEVSNLRAEVAGLAGAVKGMMDYMREEREYARGERQRPPAPPAAPQTAPAQPAQGFGAAPQHQQPWPRRPGYERSENDELRDELDDLRAELNAIHRSRNGAPGFGSAPPQAAAHAAPPIQPPPPPAPRGPNGEIWVESARAWCMPVGMQPAVAVATPAQPVAVPVAAVPTPAAVPLRPVGMGSFDFMQTGMAKIQERVAKQVLQRVDEAVEEVFSGTGLGGAEEPATPPTPDPEPEAQLPWDVVEVPNTTLFGHPAKYTPRRKDGKIDLEGFVMSNPGVLEEGAKLVGVAFEALGTLAKRAAANTSRGVAEHAGVGASPPAQIPAQVVENIPAEAQHAEVRDLSGGHPTSPATFQGGGNGSGSFPAV